MTTKYNNVWLSLKKAKTIAHDLELSFWLQEVDEDVLFVALMAHPLYEDHMWLDVDWSDENEVMGIHVGVYGGFIV